MMKLIKRLCGPISNCCCAGMASHAPNFHTPCLWVFRDDPHDLSIQSFFLGRVRHQNLLCSNPKTTGPTPQPSNRQIHGESSILLSNVLGCTAERSPCAGAFRKTAQALSLFCSTYHNHITSSISAETADCFAD